MFVQLPHLPSQHLLVLLTIVSSCSDPFSYPQGQGYILTQVGLYTHMLHKHIYMFVQLPHLPSHHLLVLLTIVLSLVFPLDIYRPK